MKKVIIPIICLCLLLSGCGVYWDYCTITKAIDNEYFKTKVIYEDDECMIIQNEVTGEHFLVVGGGYGITITPILVDLMSDNANDFSSSMSEGAEGN